MTSKSNGQFSISSKGEIFEKCKQANFIDCRINAYPEHTEYKGIVRYPPNFVFIDLDLTTFSKYKDPSKALDRSLKNTMKNILSAVSQDVHLAKLIDNSNTNNKGDCDYVQINQQSQIPYPTVLWTGNGYHIYLPIHGIILDQINQFAKDKFPNLFSMYDGKYYGYSVSELFLKFAESHFTDGKAY